MELVLAEPDIISPAAIRFDGNGRMYVAEFITYMRDADGNNQHAPESRITRFESTKNDGVYDKRTVFVDKLVLPRTIVPLDGNSILTNETASDDIVKYTDTNNDGVADKREHVFSGIGLGRDGNLEHEQAGFVWGLDNWIYTTYNAFRIRWTPGGFLKEPTGPNSGSWGVTMDDDGKMWFIDAGGERGPMNFQVPIHYGAFTVPDQYEPGFHAVWPEIGLSDTQGGMVRVRMPVGRLNHLTAASGSDVVRAHRVPADLRGDLLISEPVGRLIRRARIVKDGGLTQLRNAYPGAEFITSTDPLFRPINITTAPDGSVYIADMYHGIIQESNWTRPGSYLRRKIEQYQMDKIIAHGRIWRLRFDGVPGVPATPAGPAAQATPEIPPQPALALDLDAPADAAGDAGAARRAPQSRERLVARHRAAAARAAAGQVGRAGAPDPGALVEQPAGAIPCALDARRAECARRRPRPRTAQGSRIRGCGSRPSAPARRSTRQPTARSPTTTAR